MSEAINKSEHINSLIQYIENNISADLETEILSNVGYISRGKLYYDFYNISGHSVKEYVRKRRLSNALALIKASDMSLTEIAFQCGYSSYLTLWRAVKKTLGLTPSDYKESNTYYFFPPFNGKPLQPVNVSNETIPRMLRLSFYHSIVKNIENTAINYFLQVFPDYEGRIFGRNGKQKGNKYCYEVYLTDIDKNYDGLLKYGFEIMQEIPCISDFFATSTVRNEESKINAAWDYLYSEWLQNSMFEYTDGLYYEEYILKNGKPVKLKLYLPIRERGEETKITLINNLGLHFITARAKGYNAEETASKTVLNYMMKHYPYILNSSKEIYLCKDEDFYICGVKVCAGLPIVKDENIVSISTADNNYLVLESGVMGDYDRYAELLFLFARDNGMDADFKKIFAVYDARESFRNPKIKMYCPVKVCTK